MELDREDLLNYKTLKSNQSQFIKRNGQVNAAKTTTLIIILYIMYIISIHYQGMCITTGQR